MIRSILVFGAGGQTGRELLNFATIRGLPVVGATRLESDITKIDTVLRFAEFVKPQMIVNAAAYTAVDKAESEASQAYAINSSGAENVARAAQELGANLLHISTDYVFDGCKAAPYLETDPVAPLGVYGASKAEGELRVRSVMPEAIILRTAWVYGVYGRNFLKTILSLANQQQNLRVVADQYGCPTATADIAEAVIAVAVSATLSGGIYHFAGTGVTTWHGFAQYIVDTQSSYSKRKPQVEAITTKEYPTPARRPANSVFESDHFAQTFGYRAQPWQRRTREAIELLLNPKNDTQIGGALT